MAPSNPRILRVACDDVSVTLYQIVCDETALSAIQSQSLANVLEASPSKIIWFKTSFAQVMQILKHEPPAVRSSKVLAIRIKYKGLEDILLAGRLSYEADVTTSGVRDRAALVHVIWDVGRTAMGARDRARKAMHIGVSGELLAKLLNEDINTILSIEDVTGELNELRAMVHRSDDAGAENIIASINEEDLPLDNDEIEANLGML